MHKHMHIYTYTYIYIYQAYGLIFILPAMVRPRQPSQRQWPHLRRTAGVEVYDYVLLNFYKWFQFRNEDLTGSRVEVLLPELF